MKLPRYTATTPPPRGSGLARAGDIGALTRTGEGAKLRSIAAIGQTLGGIGKLLFSARQKRKSLDDSLQWGRATQKTNEVAYNLEKVVRETDYKGDELLSGDPDYLSSQLELFVKKKDKKIIEKLAEFDNQTGEIAQSFLDQDEKDKYENWQAERRLLFEKSITSAYNEQHGSYARAGFEELMLAAAKNGNLETANSYAEVMDKYNLITPEKSLDYKQQNESIASAVIKQQLRADLGATAQTIAEQSGSWEAAEEWLSSPANTKGVPLDIVDSVIENVGSLFRVEKRKEQEKLEGEREAQRGTYYEMMEEENFGQIYEFLEASLLDETEQDRKWQDAKAEMERVTAAEDIITDQRVKQDILDLAAAIPLPERKVTTAEVRKAAYEARYGETPTIDDAAYDEIRDAIRRAEKDEPPFTKQYIETGIGELMTGAPSSPLGVPLPTLRSRDDALKHATNLFGRYVRRIPGVMEAINAKYPPPKVRTAEPEKDNPAYDFDGERIGHFNPNGSITLNKEGVKRLLELAGYDKEKARDMALQNRYVIPEAEEK